MVELGEADAFISGQNRNYPDTIRPALEIIGKEEGTNKVAGMYIIMSNKMQIPKGFIPYDTVEGKFAAHIGPYFIKNNFPKIFRQIR